MTQSAVYLDYNASAPVRPGAADAAVAAMALVGNPSSVHGEGRFARRTVEQARASVASMVGADPSQVIFTSGGTEANHLALLGADRARILVSAVEHPSVTEVLPAAQTLPVDGNGVVDVAALRELLSSSDAPTLVSVMLANHETGVVQPVTEIAELIRAHGALLHCDAVQAAGKLAIDFEALGVDMLTLSGHKIGAPKGVGALVTRPGLALRAQMRGGGQELGHRAGTENLPGIAGFGAAAEAANAELDRMEQLAAWRDDLEARIVAIAPAVQIFGRSVQRLVNTSCLTMPGVANDSQVMHFDLAGVALSAGAACSSGKVGPSPVLRAMGIDENSAATAIRVSLGWQSAVEDVERFFQVWRETYFNVATKSGATARSVS